MTLRNLLSEWQAQYILRRNALHHQRRIIPKAKTRIEGGIANQYAALLRQAANGFQSLLH